MISSKSRLLRGGGRRDASRGGRVSLHRLIFKSWLAAKSEKKLSPARIVSRRDHPRATAESYRDHPRLLGFFFFFAFRSFDRYSGVARRAFTKSRNRFGSVRSLTMSHRGEGGQNERERAEETETKAPEETDERIRKLFSFPGHSWITRTGVHETNRRLAADRRADRIWIIVRHVYVIVVVLRYVSPSCDTSAIRACTIERKLLSLSL